LSSTTGASVTANPNSTATYTVTGNLNNCTATAQVIVIVNQLPVINILPDSLSGCAPRSAVFFDASSVLPPSVITSWIWNFGDAASGNFNTSTLQNPSHTYDTTGSYTITLTVTSNNGCSQTDSIVIPVNIYSNPMASFYATPKIVPAEEPDITFTNTSVLFDNVLWDFGDNYSSTQISPSHSYDFAGTYNVMLMTTTIHGCIDFAYEEVIVVPPFSFYIPNAFTPNNDGVNDVFTGLGINAKDLTMYIYDRWGEMIYQTNDIQKPWDGKVNNSSTTAQQGVYIYLIYVTDIFDNNHEYNGSVTLLK
jgi:gliding motility-associated-like protein